MKKLIAAAVLLALGITILLGFVTAQYWTEYDDPLQGGLCTGIDSTVDGSLHFSAGIPFAWQSQPVNTELTSCAAIAVNNHNEVNLNRTELTKRYFVSWEFYANWLLFSVPLVGVAYLTGKRYAHNRD